MARPELPIRSDIAWSTPERITVRGLDFPTEILGEMDLGSYSFLQLTGRVPTPEEARLYSAIVMALLEHGITPSVLAARLTYAGAPESIQGAIAAGISGLGSVFVGSAEGAARMLSEELAEERGRSVRELAELVVDEHRRTGQPIPGIGHPLHKPIDPRTPRLWEIARQNGFSGRYVELMKEISLVAEEKSGRSLPVNATGAIGALACEIGLPWSIVRGLGVMARAMGLVGHILEESQHPMALEIWHRAEAEVSAYLRPGLEQK